MIENLHVTALGAGGDGIARDGDSLYFVAGAVPGDIVSGTAGKTSKAGITLENITIAKRGAGYQQPACAHFGQCGGCQLQHAAQPVYDQWITDKALSGLSFRNIEPEVILPSLRSPMRSRRRIGLKMRQVGKNVFLGFLAARSHQIVDIHDCPIAVPELVQLFNPLRQLFADIAAAEPPRKGRADKKARKTPSPRSSSPQWEVTLSATHTGVDMVLGLPTQPSRQAELALVDFANTQDLASLTINVGGFEEPVVIRRQPLMKFGETQVSLPPAGFMQATAAGEAALQQAVLDALPSSGTVADLFAGIGTFAIPMADKGLSVTAYEGALPAVQALKQAGRDHVMNNLNVAHRDLYRRPLIKSELSKLDAIVLDPPRGGAEAQMRELAASDVPLVVSVSCNPATFARDAELLVQGGYHFASLQPVDQFLWSTHLELLGVFARR